MDLPHIRGKAFVHHIPATTVFLLTVFLASQALADDLSQPWSARPLMSGDWQDASQEQVGVLLPKVRKHISRDEGVLVDGITRLRALPLSCHQDVVLFEGETKNASGQAGVISFLLHTKGITLLDGKADRLHALNAWNPVMIRTREQAQTYLKLFAGALTSEVGNFRILETYQEIVWKDETDRTKHQELNRKVKPLELRPDGGAWRGTGVVQYGNHVFVSTFTLAANGKVKMADDDPIGKNLPIVSTRYAGPLRYETF